MLLELITIEIRMRNLATLRFSIFFLSFEGCIKLIDHKHFFSFFFTLEDQKFLSHSFLTNIFLNLYFNILFLRFVFL